MRQFAIRFGINGNGAQRKRVRSAEDAAGDFTAIGDEQGGFHGVAIGVFSDYLTNTR
jgi:hypothetical protein